MDARAAGIPLRTIRYSRPRRGPCLHFRSLEGFEWNAVELGISDLPPALEGLRLFHLSDIHLRHHWRPELDEVIRRTNEHTPDLILFTGDFVDDKRDHRPAVPILERFVRQLKSRFGMFATLGNHDGDLLAARLLGMGVRVIIHQRVIVPANGASVELIGLPGPDRRDLNEDFVYALPKRSAGVPRVILGHYPDMIRAAQAAGLSTDLYLAGHTHGGQICLPNEFPIIRHDTLPRRLCKGAHDFGGTCLVVSRGLGFTTMPLRIFCPAEVIEIVLKRSL